VQVPPLLSFSAKPLTAVSGKSRLLSAGFRTGARRRRRVAEGYPLLLIIVIFKLKCNNLIFNEIMILNASYVCLHAFLLRQESPDLDPRG
jgi:hypothetical protein